MSAQETAVRVAEAGLGTRPWNINNAVARNIATGANIQKLGPPPGLPRPAAQRKSRKNRKSRKASRKNRKNSRNNRK